jgi:predicted molibdopterin-dependent oxidoreductase YjgC
MIEGTAKYGKGHYVPEGVDFEFVAIGKVETSKGRTVKAEVSCICPSCGVKCKFSV